MAIRKLTPEERDAIKEEEIRIEYLQYIAIVVSLVGLVVSAASITFALYRSIP